MIAHNRIPLDLPHAGTLADRILGFIERRGGDDKQIEALTEIAEQMVKLLWAYSARGENPGDAEALEVRDEAAELGRNLVAEIERTGLGADRLGQFVRNYFECLELGEEGAAISLRAGEDPRSIQRPAE